MRPQQRRMHEILICAVVLLHLTSTTLGIDIALTMPSKYCVMERVKRMLAYNCNDLRLKEVPQYMKSGVEVRAVPLFQLCHLIVHLAPYIHVHLNRDARVHSENSVATDCRLYTADCMQGK